MVQKSGPGDTTAHINNHHNIWSADDSPIRGCAARLAATSSSAGLHLHAVVRAAVTAMILVVVSCTTTREEIPLLKGDIGEGGVATCSDSQEEYPVCDGQYVNFTSVALLGEAGPCDAWIAYPFECTTVRCVLETLDTNCGGRGTAYSEEEVETVMVKGDYPIVRTALAGHHFVNSTTDIVAESMNSTHLRVGTTWLESTQLSYKGLRTITWKYQELCDPNSSELNLCKYKPNDSSRGTEYGEPSDDCTTAVWRQLSDDEASAFWREVCIKTRAFSANNSAGCVGTPTVNTCPGVKVEYGYSVFSISGLTVGRYNANGAHFHIHNPVGTQVVSSVQSQIACGAIQNSNSQWNRPMYGYSSEGFLTGDIYTYVYQCAGAATLNRAFAKLRTGSLIARGVLPGTTPGTNRVYRGELMQGVLTTIGVDTYCTAPSGATIMCHMIHAGWDRVTHSTKYASRSFCNCGDAYVSL